MADRVWVRTWSWPETPWSTGLDPTLGAILPLVGIVIGALLNVAISAAAERRRRAREAKVGARLVAEDLMMFATASDVDAGLRRRRSRSRRW